MTRRSRGRPGPEDVSAETSQLAGCELPGAPDAFRAALLDHYDAHRRDLPWRDTPDPYAVWISEVMLQQTRVETVVPYYIRWMERFPTVQVLADASEDDVLGAWEGLGYYTRARSLHRAASVVAESHGGELPRTAAALRDLPGIGPYTAGAVASIAFGQVEPAVDGNVRRVLSRWYDLADPTPAELTRLAGALVDPDRPGDWNQAVMELGATLCTPRSPSCEACPVEGHCRARAGGVEEERPHPKKRLPVPRRTRAVAVVVRRTPGRAPAYLLQRRPEDGMLAGLWEFPGAEVGEGEDAVETARYAARVAGGDVGSALREWPPFSRTYSHVVVEYHPFLFEVIGPPRSRDVPHEADVRWVAEADLAHSPLSRAQRRIARTAVDGVSFE